VPFGKVVGSVRTRSLLQSKIVAGSLGLLLTAVVGAAWFFIWFWIATFVVWLFGPKWELILPYLEPPFVIPFFYIPFLARIVALRLTDDAQTARVTLVIGVGGGVIASWWILVNFRL
jgi:hypothetical protein